MNAIHEVYPYLRVRNAARAIEFYAQAFGGVEQFRLTEPGGRIGHAGSRFAVDRIGQPDQRRGRNQAFGAVRAERVDEARVSHPITHRDVRDVRANGLDHARGLHAHPRGQRDRIQAAAKVGVGEIEAHCLMAQANLTGTGVAHFDVLVAQHVGTTGFMTTASPSITTLPPTVQTVDSTTRRLS